MTDKRYNNNLIIIGLLGGIGAGKSSVAQCFEKLGAVTINADQLVHKALQKSGIQKQITDLWGQHLLSNGEIDRAALGKIVFADRTNLQTLEAIVHPQVIAEMKQALPILAASGAKAVVLDVPLLWESGLHEHCQRLVFVDSPLDIREQRVQQNRNWPAGEISKREKFQGDLASKLQIANDVIKNEGDFEQIQQQVKTIWGSLPLRDDSV